jgi:hypothetical protein
MHLSLNIRLFLPRDFKSLTHPWSIASQMKVIGVLSVCIALGTAQFGGFTTTDYRLGNDDGKKAPPKPKAPPKMQMQQPMNYVQQYKKSYDYGKKQSYGIFSPLPPASLSSAHNALPTLSHVAGTAHRLLVSGGYEPQKYGSRSYGIFPTLPHLSHLGLERPALTHIDHAIRPALSHSL